MSKKYNRSIRMAAINEANEAILEVQMMAEEMEAIFAEIEDSLRPVEQVVRQMFGKIADYFLPRRVLQTAVVIPSGIFTAPTRRVRMRR